MLSRKKNKKSGSDAGKMKRPQKFLFHLVNRGPDAAAQQETTSEVSQNF